MTEAKHNTDIAQRRIRSFVRREGRMTEAQQRALENLWPRYGIEFGRPQTPESLFDRSATVSLEIGFGNGASLASMAAAEPDGNFLGIEVHRPGVGQLLQTLDARQIQNVRVWCHDAVEVLGSQIEDQTLDRVLLFFPDPWPKRKHHKRRLVQVDFVTLLARKLKPGGLLHMATDWQDYAAQMLTTLEACALYTNQAGPGHYAERPDYRPETRFEARGKRLGHGVRDLIFRRT